MAKNGTNGNGTGGATPTNTWAGAGRRGDGRIRVAIVGVGNCASSHVQGRYYYKNADDDDFIVYRITIETEEPLPRDEAATTSDLDIIEEYVRRNVGAQVARTA